jgi:aryl-alcohol dehydrogenase-like predicted oxidoreductase
MDVDAAKKISKIGLGTWQFGSSDWGYGEEYAGHQARVIVRRALELGVTLFDTAEIYGGGRSERILGSALGPDRESVFIADKIFPLIPEAPLVRRRAVASANRLGVTRLDLYQVHYPNPFVRDHAIMRGMRSLQDTGVVDEVGVSNYSVARWRAAEDALARRILSNQVEYSLVQRSAENELLPYAESNRRVIIAFSPLARGLLAGTYHGANQPTGPVRANSPLFRPEGIERTGPLMAVLRDVAQAHGATPAQIALAWVIRHPSVAAIPGASSVGQLESNVAAAEILLADDEYEALRAASQQFREFGRPWPPRGRMRSELKHCVRAARYLAKTAWHDLKVPVPRSLTPAQVRQRHSRPPR